MTQPTQSITDARPVATDRPLDTDEGKGSKVATIIVAIGVLLLLVPFVPLLFHAIGDQYFYPQLVPENRSLDAFRRALFQDPRLLNSALVSARIAVATTFLAVLIGLPAARAMGMYVFKGRTAIEFLLLTPVLISGIAVGLGLQLTFLRLGLAGNEVGVTLVHLVPALPYVIIILGGVFSNYEPEFENQARSLGASRWKTWWYVMIPAIRPGLAVAAFFAFLISCHQFVLTLLIGGGSVISLPILVFSLISGGNLQLTSVVSLMFLLPALLMLLLVSRYLQPGKALGEGVTKP